MRKIKDFLIKRKIGILGEFEWPVGEPVSKPREFMRKIEEHFQKF